MPILHLQAIGQAQRPDGQVVQVPPDHVLRADGPWVEVGISLHDRMAQTLVQAGQEIAAPVQGRALIDTGASHTAIDESVAVSLRLPVVNRATMRTPSTAAAPDIRNVYPISVRIVGFPTMFNMAGAVGANLAPQGYSMLLGRDFLSRFVMVYNGMTGETTLAY